MKHFHCPVNGWDCPYYKDDGCLCTLKNPIEECDDFYGVWGNCDSEDYDEEEN